MQMHASCAARGGAGVLLLGPPGAGKSDLLLRLIHDGFALVADDQVQVDAGVARPVERLAGLLEIRGVGLVRFPHMAPVRLALVVQLSSEQADRLPEPTRHAGLGLPMVSVDPARPSACQRVGIALDCATGRRGQIAGAFTA